MARVLEQEHISRIVLVPSLLRSLVESISHLPGYQHRPSYCTSSGEALSPILANAFLQKSPQSILLNLYGCSEVAADSSYYDVNCSDMRSSIPIGRPIANIEIFF
jgi:surfactin family lipopeptide synthetase C